MSGLGVAEAAERMGVSGARVRALIAESILPARKLKQGWLIDESDLALAIGRPGVRPLGEHMAGLLLRLLSGEELRLVGQDKLRLFKMRDRLLAESDPAELVAAWMRHHGEVVRWQVKDNKLDKLREDDRVQLSGFSHPRSGQSASGQVECWVWREDLDGLDKSYWPKRGASPNVVLHISDQPLPQPIPLGWVICDLAAHRLPREKEQADRLIREVLS